MSPLTSILPQYDMDRPSFFAKKQNFYRNFVTTSDSMDGVKKE
jgi:hypothetical protein